MTTALTSNLDCCTYVKPTQVLQTALIADGAKAVTATANVWFRRAQVYARKDLAGTINVGAISVGWSGTASQQPIPLAAGAVLDIEPPVGVKFALGDLYLKVATDGDGVVVIYS